MANDPCDTFLAWCRGRRTRAPWPVPDILPAGVALLWAVACELDEDAATWTGEYVCRACSGRGRLICHSSEVVRVPVRIRWNRTQVMLARQGWAETEPCPCNGPTRPDTVSLAWLVSQVASMRSPILRDWPEQWLVDLDKWQSEGRTDMRATWWLAFAEWTMAGKDPEAQVLADVLRPRVSRPRLDDWVPIQVDLGIPAEVAFGYRSAMSDDEMSAWEEAAAASEASERFDALRAWAERMSADDALRRFAGSLEASPNLARFIDEANTQEWRRLETRSLGGTADHERMLAEVALTGPLPPREQLNLCLLHGVEPTPERLRLSPDALRTVIEGNSRALIRAAALHGTEAGLVESLLRVPRIGMFWVEHNTIPPWTVRITYTGTAYETGVLDAARSVVSLTTNVEARHIDTCPWWRPSTEPHVGSSG